MDDTKELTDSTGSGALRGVGIGCGLLVAVPVLVVLGFLVTYAVQRGTPEEYERVAPEEMMSRLSAVSHEAYGVLGLDGDTGPETDPDPSAPSLCYPGGLESIADEPVEGAYSLADGWETDGVTEADAKPALKRLHRHLKDEGWDIDAYEKFDGTAYRAAEMAGPAESLTLRASRAGSSDDGGDTRLLFEWRDGSGDGGRFSGSVVSPCAYDTK
ncbi:hypothetical protein [Streptomyces niveus]|uniref:Uncharacterized protein n=1 Tax=Streptomyces niveus TaxID=193462 RepID=A0ABZ2A8P2_STRNV|nr:hypothetical protein [Streptomyces niveus]